jgi:hypothetical protein
MSEGETRPIQNPIVVNNLDNEKIDAIMEALKEVHVNLINIFDTYNVNTKFGEILTEQINKIGSCIVNMGDEEIDYFNPLDHVSGLEVPDFLKSATEVIERTKKCYKLGSVSDDSISPDGRIINIRFDGKQGGEKFVVIGKIESDFWDGSEAIDYIYSRDGGKMSVKSFEKGKWIDVNKYSNKYKISFEVINKEEEQNFRNDDIRNIVIENEEDDIDS